jgi:hypothetical protein
MSVFIVDGYWKDNKSEFAGYLINEFDDVPDGFKDDDIFYFGLSETDLKNSSEDDGLEFVITDYKNIVEGEESITENDKAEEEEKLIEREKNKLIAEFMGAEWHNNFFKDVCIISPSNISYKFHTSWDWLMPVVEKIENTNLFPTTENAVNVTIGATLYCLIQDNYGEKFEIVGQGKTKLLSVYQAVVEFINFYNKNKKK